MSNVGQLTGSHFHFHLVCQNLSTMAKSIRYHQAYLKNPQANIMSDPWHFRIPWLDIFSQFLGTMCQNGNNSCWTPFMLWIFKESIIPKRFWFYLCKELWWAKISLWGANNWKIWLVWSAHWKCKNSTTCSFQKPWPQFKDSVCGWNICSQSIENFIASSKVQNLCSILRTM